MNKLWGLGLAVMVCNGLGHAQEPETVEMQAKRYLQSCITQAALHMVDQGASAESQSCADMGLPPPHAVPTSRVIVTGTGSEDFYVSVTDSNHRKYEGDLAHYPVLSQRPMTPAQSAQAKGDALEVGRQNLARQCEQLRSTLTPDTDQFRSPFRDASCADLGFDPERLELEVAGKVNPDILKIIRQCQVAVSQAWERLPGAEFKALNGQSCLSPQLPLSPLTRRLGVPAEIRSTRIAVIGSGPEDVRITVVDRQGRTFTGGGQNNPALSAAQRRSLALKNDAAPVFYACLMKLEELKGQGRLPDTLNGQTCEEIQVETYGLHTRIKLYPWTPEKYQLLLTAPTGRERRWPHRTLPTEEQASAQKTASELVTNGISLVINAALALVAFSYLVRLPRVRFLDVIFGVAGLLALILTVPTIWQSPDFGDAVGLAYAYALGAGFALFGSSLWLPYAAYGHRSLLSSLGMAFVAGAVMVIVSAPILTVLSMLSSFRFIWWIYPIVGLGLATYWQFVRPPRRILEVRT